MKVPKRFGKYKIIGELGSGSMGLVLKAEQDFINRKVAIKILPKELEKSHSMLVKRFRNEAIFAAKIIHPYLVAIFDVGYEAGFHYIVMEYVEGNTLDEACKEQKWSTLQQIEIFIKITKALCAIHSVEVVHRDLKATNIIYSKEGLVKILDFGIAKVSNDSSTLTKAGSIMGSPDFMSPEQARGEEVDHRSDIFSFGVMMFLLLGGINPFHRTKMEVREIVKKRQQLITPPSVKEVKTDIPSSVDRIVMKCLSGKREQRFQSAEELLEQLERCKRGLARRTFNPSAFLSGFQKPVKKQNWNLPILANVVLIAFMIFIKIALNLYSDENQDPTTRVQKLESEGKFHQALFILKETQEKSEESKEKASLQKKIDQLEQQLMIEVSKNYIKQLLKQERKQEAIELYRILLKLFPDDTDLRLLATYFKD